MNLKMNRHNLIQINQTKKLISKITNCFVNKQKNKFQIPMEIEGFGIKKNWGLKNLFFLFLGSSFFGSSFGNNDFVIDWFLNVCFV